MGAIQALQLNIPGKPVMDGALANGLLINVTQDTVLRFLTPFLLEEKHVDTGIRILRKQLAAAAETSQGGEEGGGDGVKASWILLVEIGVLSTPVRQALARTCVSTTIR